jgi:hypothetical protein
MLDGESADRASRRGQQSLFGSTPPGPRWELVAEQVQSLARILEHLQTISRDRNRALNVIPL